MRVDNNVAQTIYAVIPAPVRNQQCLLVFDHDKPCCITARGSIEPFRAAGCEDNKGGRCNHRPVMRMNVVDLLLDGGSRRCAVKTFQRSDVRNLMRVDQWVHDIPSSATSDWLHDMPARPESCSRLADGLLHKIGLFIASKRRQSPARARLQRAVGALPFV